MEPIPCEVLETIDEIVANSANAYSRYIRRAINSPAFTSPRRVMLDAQERQFIVNKWALEMKEKLISLYHQNILQITDEGGVNAVYPPQYYGKD
jgi:hypothetical protein